MHSFTCWRSPSIYSLRHSVWDTPKCIQNRVDKIDARQLPSVEYAAPVLWNFTLGKLCQLHEKSQNITLGAGRGTYTARAGYTDHHQQDLASHTGMSVPALPLIKAYEEKQQLRGAPLRYFRVSQSTSQNPLLIPSRLQRPIQYDVPKFTIKAIYLRFWGLKRLLERRRSPSKACVPSICCLI